MKKEIYCAVSNIIAEIDADSIDGDFQHGAIFHRNGPCPGCTYWEDDPDVLAEEAIIAECLKTEGLPSNRRTKSVSEREFIQMLVDLSRFTGDEKNIVIGKCSDYGSS